MSTKKFHSISQDKGIRGIVDQLNNWFQDYSVWKASVDASIASLETSCSSTGIDLSTILVCDISGGDFDIVYDTDGNIMTIE